MDKKKIAGVFIFAIALSVYVGYPNMVETLEQRRIESMLKNERYEEVYEALSKEKLDIDSWEYLALMRSEYYLGQINRFNIRLVNLINNKETKIVQALLDEFGENLSEYYISIDQMGGIIFKDEDVRNAVAYKYFADSYGYDLALLERAREVRGEINIVDIIDIHYYSEVGDIESLVNKYDEVIEELKEDYYTRLSSAIIKGRSDS